MNTENIPFSDKDKIYLFISCSKGSKTLYRYDLEMDTLVVSRVFPLDFPASYGVIPNSHHDDGAQLDCLLLSHQIIPGSIIEARPIGLLRLEGNKIKDDILIAVPLKDEAYKDVKELDDMSKTELNALKTFSERFKSLKVKSVYDSDKAGQVIEHAVKRFKEEMS